MRSLAAPLILLASGCTTTGSESGQAPVRAECDQRTNCFNQRAVRDFSVLDNSSVVVFVGPQRCPYLVRVDGFYCNLRNSAFISFQDFDGLICSLDRSQVYGDLFGGRDEYCEIRSVEPLNDDELVETYAADGKVEPLPATGSGELEVIETDEEAAPPVGPEADMPPSPSEVGAESS